MSKNYFVILTLYYFVVVVYGCDKTCSNHGVCKTSNENSMYCDCRYLWGGDNCEQSWLSDKTFAALFWLYTAYTLLLQGICLVFISRQIFIVTRNNWKSVSLPNYVLYLFFVGCLARFINFAVDPHIVRDVLNVSTNAFLFDLPYILWFIGGFMLYLYWIEIQTNLNVRKVPIVTKYRPILITVAIITAALVLGCDLWYQSTLNPLGQTLYNIFFIIMFVVLILMITLSGIQLVRTMKRAWEHTSNIAHYKFVKRLTIYMLYMDACLIVSVISLIIYLGIKASKDPSKFIILFTLFRTEEFGVVFATLLFLTRKKPKTPNDTPPSDTSVPLKSISNNSTTVYE